jgi:hypothetical protein
MPHGWAGFSARFVRGDFVIGRIVPPNYVPDPSVQPRASQSVNRFLGRWVRWNTRTGRVEVFSSETAVEAANASGWLLLSGSTPDYPLVLVGPDGTSRRIPTTMGVRWISPDGRTLLGAAGKDDPRMGRWTCR